MKRPTLYRRRLIPRELVLLKRDIILFQNEDCIVTCWDTIRPKKTLHHGTSCYFLKDNIKVSKFYGRDGHFICWYCDIITHTYDAETDTYTFIDLLADVLIYPDGTVKVVDLDELADAAEQQLLSPELLLFTLRRTNSLLSSIYDGSFAETQDFVTKIEDSRIPQKMYDDPLYGQNQI